MTEVLGWFCARLYGRGGAQPGREGAAVCRTRYGTHGAVTPHCDNESMPVYQAFRFELDPSTTTRSALGSHAGASRFAYNWGLALVKDHLDARQALEVLAMRQGAGAGEARARAAETAGPVVDPLLVAQGVEPGNRRVHPLVERELQGGLQLGLRRPGPGTEGVLRFKRWRPGRQAHGVPELQEQGWPAKLPLQHRGDPGPRRPHVQLPRLGVIRTKEHRGRCPTRWWPAWPGCSRPPSKRRPAGGRCPSAARWNVTIQSPPTPRPSSGLISGSTTLPSCPLVSCSRTPDPSLSAPEGWPGSTGSSPEPRRAPSAGPGPEPSWPVVTAGWPTCAGTPCTSSQRPGHRLRHGGHRGPGREEHDGLSQTQG